MYAIECVIAGAGAIGLAIAKVLSERGVETLVMESAPHFGSETSSRNSEVIHAGIYYPQGSLKARLCVHGRDLLYAYCQTHNIPHHRCGKLIVATHSDQIGDLSRLRASAHANGVMDVDWATPSDIATRAPGVSCVAALSSPSTGIIDSHQLMLSFLGDAEKSSASIAYRTCVTGGSVEGERIALAVNDETSPSIETRFFINAAGLHAQALASNLMGLPSPHIPPRHLAKGNYFALKGRSPFKTLVYPVPEPGGLGVHLTLDMGGQARFGPDVEWVDGINYDVDAARAAPFYNAIRKFWPDLPDESLQPAYAGIRPKLSGRGEPAADFRIDGPETHGVAGLVNLFGIESPGLTGSLAIAEYVADLVSQ